MIYEQFITTKKTYFLATSKDICHKFGLAEFFTRHCIDLEKNLNVLDVGCGVGPIGIFLSEFYNAKVIGVDIDKKSCNFCKKNISYYNANIKVENINFNLFKNKKFDLIISNPPINFIGSKNLINEYQDKNGNDLVDYILDYAKTNKISRIILITCDKDFDTKKFILNKINNFGFYVDSLISEKLDSNRLGVKENINGFIFSLKK